MDKQRRRWTFWSLFHPNLTFRLIIIIIFLALVALGNLFGVYEGITKSDFTLILYSLVSVFLYAVPAYGLFKLKAWARILEIVLSIGFIILGIIMMLFENTATGLFIIGTHGFILAYLLSKECKMALKFAS